MEHAIPTLQTLPVPRAPPPSFPALPLPKNYLKTQPVPEDGEPGEDEGER